MSQRYKRQSSRPDEGPVTKRRKGRPVGVGSSKSHAVLEDDEATSSAMESVHSSRGGGSYSDLKAMNTIYNRNTTEAPAELFRKDLISAMKLPDSEPLKSDEFWLISSQWKQEWERGVQVPVNPDSLPGPAVTVVSTLNSTRYPSSNQLEPFKLPKHKYIRITKNDFFKPDDHVLSNVLEKADKACLYDLDDCDIAWLNILNGERACMGLPAIKEDRLEKLIAELEVRCWDKVQTIVKEEEGLGLEFDENVICDVCRSPDSEEGNEMVFCDCCNICVHQACYGITTIPSGSWLCRTCVLGKRPECVLCPNKGGAMKCTRSGNKWAHVSCALWIPEVSIGCVEKMEPITKISSIPQSRWALICVLCRERLGACIQCSVKTCKTAYHVTCAFKHGLEMRAIIEDENADDGVKLRSYCSKHSLTSKKSAVHSSGSDEEEYKRKKRKDMSSEERSVARANKLKEIESEFEKHVNCKEVIRSTHDLDPDGVMAIHSYWILRRRSNGNKPLVAPRSQDLAKLGARRPPLLTHHQEQADIDKMKMFVQLRQDLERVRNLCYMVSRREKLSRTLLKLREQTFSKQVSILSESRSTMSMVEITAVKEANHGPSIYDRLYSHSDAPDLSTDFETMLARIAGIKSPTPEERSDLNGILKKSGENNPYKKIFPNGCLSKRRSSLYGGSSLSSGSEMESRHRINRSTSRNRINRSTSRNRINRSTSRNRINRSTSRNRINRSTSSNRINRSTSRNRINRSTSRNRINRSSSRSRNRSRSKLLDSGASSAEEKVKPLASKDRKKTLSKKKEKKSLFESVSSEEDEGKDKSRKSKTTRKNKSLQQMEQEIASHTSDSDELLPIKPVSKPVADLRKIIQPSSIYSDTDSDTGASSVKTKASMKQFIPQKKKKKETRKSDRDEDYSKDKENIKTTKRKENETNAAKELIVPQRQAAKKASEKLHGTTASSGKLPIPPAPSLSPEHKHKTKSKRQDGSHHHHHHKSSRAERESKEKEMRNKHEKEKEKDSKESKESSRNRLEAKENKEEKSSHRSRAEKENKELNKSKEKEMKKERKSGELSKPPELSPVTKDSKPPPAAELGIVPQRQAAKKAAETIKTVKPTPPPLAKEEVKPKKPEVPKPHRRSTKSSVSSSSSSSSSSGSSSSSSSSSSSGSSSSSESEQAPKQQPHKIRLSSASSDSDSGVVDSNKKLRKTPDKKLKTSDGRPEPEFQLPPPKGTESAPPSSSPLPSPLTAEQSGGDRLDKSEGKHATPSNTELCVPSIEKKALPTSSPAREMQENVPKIEKLSNSFDPVGMTFDKKSPRRSLDKSPVRENLEDRQAIESLLKADDSFTEFLGSRRPSLSAPTLFQHRSIFSPQPGGKENTPADLFSEFDSDLLQGDDLGGEETFGLGKDDMVRGSLSFSFGRSEFLFPEDSKEDSARETLNLVEKLRLEYAKKSNTDFELPPTPAPRLSDEEKEREEEEKKQRELEEQRQKELMEQQQRELAEKLRLEKEREEQWRKQKEMEEQERLQREMEEKKRQEEILEQQRKLEEQRRLEEQKRIEEQMRLEEERRIEEQKKLEEQRRIEEQKRLEEQRRLEELRILEEQKRLQQELEEKRVRELEELRQQEMRNRMFEETERILKQELERQKELELQKAAEQKRQQEEQLRLQEQKRQEELKRQQELEEKKRREQEHARLMEEKRKREEEERKILAEKQKMFEQQKNMFHSELDLNMVKNNEVPFSHFTGYPGQCMLNDKTPGTEKLDQNNMAQSDERWVPPSTYDPIPSPYTDLHGRNKWADSVVMPSRRSSTSSSISEDDQTDPVPDAKSNSSNTFFPHSAMPDNAPFHPYSEASQFVNIFPGAPPPPSSMFGSQFPTPYAMLHGGGAQFGQPPHMDSSMFPHHYGQQYPAQPKLPGQANPSHMQHHVPNAMRHSTPNALPTSAAHQPSNIPQPNSISHPPNSVAQATPLPHTQSNVPQPKPLSHTPNSIAQPTSLPHQTSSIPQPKPLSHPTNSIPQPMPLSHLTNSIPQPRPLSHSSNSRPQPRILSHSPKSNSISQPTSISHQPSSIPEPTVVSHDSNSKPQPTDVSHSTNSAPQPQPNHTPSIPHQGQGPVTPQSQPLTPATPHSQPCTPVTPQAMTPSQIPASPAGEAFSASPSKSIDKKSPAKPTRVSARVQSQQKSPASEPPTPPASKTRVREVVKKGGKAKSNGARRPRAKGKKNMEYDENTIHSKLMGTVYEFDFDDEFDDNASPSVENLRAMRERRRSTDHEVKSVKSSPARPVVAKVKYSLKPPPSPSPSPSPSPELEQLVAPIMPGPVDMRTYNSYQSSSSYETMLGNTLTSVATDEVSDLVEDLEKELESLTNEKVRGELKSPAGEPEQIIDTSREQETSPPPDNNKILLSDSRNQLKVKIKGPFLDANYAVNAAPQIPVAAIPPMVMSSGTSNLRRMRKKELLHQYCSQDMNMDEPITNNTPIASVPLAKTINSIPKAITSMSTIPTKEDYKTAVDTNMEKKKKKDRLDEEEKESFSVDLKRKLKIPPACPTPKLKIKIGGSQPTISVDDDEGHMSIRPPKKRITNPSPVNNFKEMRRENMKFRKKVMADFDESDRPPSKKKKKKKNSCAHVELINNDHATPKLIIRLGPRDSSSQKTTNISIVSESTNNSSTKSSVSELRKVRTAKTTPIRLKLKRCEEGYAMKTETSPEKPKDSQVR